MEPHAAVTITSPSADAVFLPEETDPENLRIMATLARQMKDTIDQGLLQHGSRYPTEWALFVELLGRIANEWDIEADGALDPID